MDDGEVESNDDEESSVLDIDSPVGNVCVLSLPKLLVADGPLLSVSFNYIAPSYWLLLFHSDRCS